MSNPTLLSRAVRIARAVLLSGTVVLAGCTTTGNRFDTTDLRFLVPGETTLQDATLLLQGEPTNVYRSVDGASIARWAHSASLVTDAVYVTQELWLAFDAHGRFLRVVKSHNIPHANLYQDGRRVDVPLSAMSDAVTAYPVNPSAPVAEPAVSNEAPPEYPLPHTAVSYPLGR